MKFSLIKFDGRRRMPKTVRTVSAHGARPSRAQQRRSNLPVSECNGRLPHTLPEGGHSSRKHRLGRVPVAERPCDGIRGLKPTDKGTTMLGVAARRLTANQPSHPRARTPVEEVSSVATRRRALPDTNHGLKPMATIRRSLRDGATGLGLAQAAK